MNSFMRPPFCRTSQRTTYKTLPYIRTALLFCCLFHSANCFNSSGEDAHLHLQRTGYTHPAWDHRQLFATTAEELQFLAPQDQAAVLRPPFLLQGGQEPFHPLPQHVRSSRIHADTPHLW